jgi:hypothetical protein
MNQNPRHTDADKSGLLARALELASELSGSRPAGRESDASASHETEASASHETDAWSTRAHHVGDIAVLALALSD